MLGIISEDGGIIREMGKRIREGRRIKTLTPYNMIIPYIMSVRSDSQNNIATYVDVSAADNLIRRLRSEGYVSIGILHVLLAAYVRALSQRPGVNRFIRGQKIYARNGIIINIIVKRKMSIDSADTSVKLHLEPTDTLIDIYNKWTELYNRIIETDDNGMDKTARIICYIPGLVKKFVIGTMRFLDYFGLLPRAIVNVSPFHGSMFITNMASLNIPPIVHHLYNFGNVPVFIAFGAKRYQIVANDDGTVTKHRVIDIIANMDERICDGFYYASTLKLFKKYFQNPEELLKAPETVVEDIP